MSEAVVSVRAWLHQALAGLQDVSARAPGTPTTQALLLGALVAFLTYRLRKKRYNLPPGPRRWPLLGNIMGMHSKDELFFQTLKRWADEKYGPVITFYMGPVRCVALNSVEVVMEALVQKGTDFAGRPYMYTFDLISEGSKDIAFADYTPAWKLRRKIAMQAMRHFMRGPHLEKVVHHVISMIMEEMAAEAGPFDPSPYCSTLMFHVIHNICFGGQRPLDDPDIQRLIEQLDLANREIGKGLLEDIIPLLRFWPTKRFKTVVRVFTEGLSYIDERIQEHRKRFSPDNIQDLTDSILLAQSEVAREESAEVMAMFSESHVKHLIFDVFGAGVDTSRVSLTWAILFMAGHPETQKRVQKEIDAATGSRMPSARDRPQLQYTEAVLNEVLRLSTVAPMGIPHKTLCDTTVGGYDVPEGTMVFTNLWAIHHDPNTWDQPEQLIPERFLDEQGKLKSKPETWLPFSAGRRVCMGESVARPELLLLLSSLLKRFTISLPQGHVYDPGPRPGGSNQSLTKPFKIVVTPR